MRESSSANAAARAAAEAALQAVQAHDWVAFAALCDPLVIERWRASTLAFGPTPPDRSIPNDALYIRALEIGWQQWGAPLEQEGIRVARTLLGELAKRPEHSDHQDAVHFLYRTVAWQADDEAPGAEAGAVHVLVVRLHHGRWYVVPNEDLTQPAAAVLGGMEPEHFWSEAAWPLRAEEGGGAEATGGST